MLQSPAPAPAPAPAHCACSGSHRLEELVSHFCPALMSSLPTILALSLSVFIFSFLRTSCTFKFVTKLLFFFAREMILEVETPYLNVYGIFLSLECISSKCYLFLHAAVIFFHLIFLNIYFILCVSWKAMTKTEELKAGPCKKKKLIFVSNTPLVKWVQSINGPSFFEIKYRKRKNNNNKKTEWNIWSLEWFSN